MERPEKRPAEKLRELYLRERAEVRKMRYSGECDGQNRPACYERCPHSYYCSELSHMFG